MNCAKRITLLLCLVAIRRDCFAAVPTSALYPFPGRDLQEIRAISKAECIPEAPELKEAWQLYFELRGAWMPGAPKPKSETIRSLDRLKANLDQREKPDWYLEVLRDPRSRQPRLAERIGDSIFSAEKDTPKFQALKALAIVYLTEHELDRAGAANDAGRCLTVLTIIHPWDWELHALYGRLLVDAGMAGPGLRSESYSIFLNPDPDLDDLKFFAFIGSVTARSNWSEIQMAIRQAAVDRQSADEAISQSGDLFGKAVKAEIVPQKGQ